MNLMFDREVIGDTIRLILEIENRECLDQFALKMINHNNIEYLAPMEIMQYDNRNYLQYYINNKTTLDNRLSGTLRKDEVMQILGSIITAFEETDAYMLSGDGMLLSADRVYVDGQNRCIFLYLPFEHERSVGRISFLQEVVERITPDYDDKDVYLFNILNAFNRGAISKLSDLKEILRKNSTELLSVDEKPPMPERVQVSDGLQPSEVPQASGKLPIPGRPQTHENREIDKPQPSADMPFAIPGKNGNVSINIPGSKKDGKKEKKDNKDSKKEGKKNSRNNKKNAGQQDSKEEKRSESKKWPDIPLFSKKAKETNENLQIPQPIASRQEHVQSQNDDMYESYEQTVMMERPQTGAFDSEATVYLDTSGKLAQLERKNTGECLELVGDNAIVGSGTAADCQITGNKAISRNHAIINVQNGAYFITDNHSSNGTWVDGSRLLPDRAAKIRSGALIKLANEEFIFRTR